MRPFSCSAFPWRVNLHTIGLITKKIQRNMKILKAKCYLPLKCRSSWVSQPLGSNSLLIEIHDEMELSKIFWLGYCTSKGINEVFVIMASSIQQGNDVLDFHTNRYLVWSVCFFNLEIKTSPITKLIIKSNTLLHIISSSWISMHLNKEEGTCYFRKCQKINQYSIRWPFNVH